MSTTASLVARRDRALGTGAQLFYTKPLQIVRGDGVYLFDADGRRYVDMYNNVPCVGHANPAGRRGDDETAGHAERAQPLSARRHHRIRRTPDETAQAARSRAWCSAAPAPKRTRWRCGWRVLATGKRGIVCTNATYHGNSEAVGVLTRTRGEQPNAPDVRAFPFPEMYRPLAAGASRGRRWPMRISSGCSARSSILQANGSGFAGLIVCSIFANEGLPDVPRGFMPRAAEMVRAAGGLVIADEVQAGYCRTGRWWGYEVTGFTPDIVVTGKPMGNGLPLAATASSKALVDTFRADTRYFNTFASSPLQAAVGMTVLDIIERDRLRENAAAVGSALKRALARAQVALCGDRRRARRRSVRRYRDGERPRRQNARSRSRRRRRQPSQGQRLPDEQCRHLRQRREDPAAARLQTEPRRRIPRRVRRDARRNRWIKRQQRASTHRRHSRHCRRFRSIRPELELVSVSENVTFRVRDASDGAAYVLRLHRPGLSLAGRIDLGTRMDSRARRRRHRGAAAVGRTRWPRLRRVCRSTPPASTAMSGVRAGPRAQCSPTCCGTPKVLARSRATSSNSASSRRRCTIRRARGDVPADFKRHALDTDGLMGEAPFWGRFWEHPDLSPARALAAARIRACAYARRSIVSDAIAHTFSVIHADLHAGNVLVDGDRLTVIDFDDSGFGWHQYDAAVALFHFADARRIRDDRARLRARLSIDARHFATTRSR